MNEQGCIDEESYNQESGCELHDEGVDTRRISRSISEPDGALSYCLSYRHNASETERKLEMKKLWTWMDGWEEVEMIGIYFERHFPLRQGTAFRNHGGF